MEAIAVITVVGPELEQQSGIDQVRSSHLIIAPQSSFCLIDEEGPSSAKEAVSISLFLLEYYYWLLRFSEEAVESEWSLE